MKENQQMFKTVGKEKVKPKVNNTITNITNAQKEAINFKISSLQYTINRYDHYYDTINNKGNLYLTLNTFLIGGSITGYFSMNDKFDLGFFTIIGFCGVLFSLISIFFTLRAIYPYLSKMQTNEDLVSATNFSEISNKTLIEFKKLHAEYAEDSYYNDLVKQVHQLSLGLQSKFTKLQEATIYLSGAFLMLFITIYKILIS